MAQKLETTLGYLLDFSGGQGAGAANYIVYAPDMDTNFALIRSSVNQLVDEVIAIQGSNAILVLDLIRADDPGGPLVSSGFVGDHSYQASIVTTTSADDTVRITAGTVFGDNGLRLTLGSTTDLIGSGPLDTFFVFVDANGLPGLSTSAGAGVLDIWTVDWDGSAFLPATLVVLTDYLVDGDDFQDQLTVAGDATVPAQTHTRIANRHENVDRIFNGNTVNIVPGGPVLGVIGTPGLASGARLARSSITTVTIGTAALQSHARDTTRVFTISWTGTLSAVITAAGAGGLDTGAEAASTWYAVHVIGDTSRVNATAALLSLSATAPTLPAGYDVFRRLGWVRNDAGSNFIDFIQFGEGQRRLIKYVDAVSNRQVLTAGAATVVTAIALAALVPTTSQEAYIHAFQNGTQVADLLNGTAGAILATVQLGNELALSSFPTDGSQNVAYNHPAAGGLLDVCLEGYGDDI